MRKIRIEIIKISTRLVFDGLSKIAKVTTHFLFISFNLKKKELHRANE